MAHAEPTEAIRRSSHEEAFLYDFGLPLIDNTEQKHQKQESKHADTPLKPKAPIQKSSRDQLFDDPGLLALKITIFPAERENLALELELLCLKQSQPSQIAECWPRNICLCFGRSEETPRRLAAVFLLRYVYLCRCWLSCHDKNIRTGDI